MNVRNVNSISVISTAVMLSVRCIRVAFIRDKYCTSNVTMDSNVTLFTVFSIQRYILYQWNIQYPSQRLVEES